MDRSEAYKTLRLDQSADGQMVETAYWTLVRQAQTRGEGSLEAGHDIDALNEAYGTLAPGKKMRAAPQQATQVEAPLQFLDWFAEWLAQEALRTRARWQHRNPEIAMIGGAALVLMVVGIGAGASLLAVFISVLVIAAAIWAPWRKLD